MASLQDPFALTSLQRLRATPLFVTQPSARTPVAGSIDGQQTGVLWRPVPPRCPGGNLRDVARLRLDCYAPRFDEQLTFQHKVVLGVRMLIGPRFPSQFPLREHRFGPNALP